MLRQELHQLASRLGFPQQGLRVGLLHLAILALFGAVLPYNKGADFLDSVILSAYACFGVIFAAPAAAHPLPEASRPRAVARIAACVLYGSAFSWLMLIAGVATVFLTRNVVLGPDLDALFEALLLGLALSALVTSVAVRVTAAKSPEAAKHLIRLLFFGMLALFFLYSRWLPEVALQGAALCALGTVAIVASFRFPKPNLKPEPQA